MIHDADKAADDQAEREKAVGIEPAGQRRGQAVATVTENVTHPADASSAPGPYIVDGEPMPINREGVSTNRPDVPIANSLVAGAGAPTGPPEYDPSNPAHTSENQFVNDRDRAAGNVVEIQADNDGNVTVQAEPADTPARSAPRGKAAAE